MLSGRMHVFSEDRVLQYPIDFLTLVDGLCRMVSVEKVKPTGIRSSRDQIISEVLCHLLSLHGLFQVSVRQGHETTFSVSLKAMTSVG